jgi:CelD/BcsL family acetyltransferase involved in cellulose biosynthesis
MLDIALISDIDDFAKLRGEWSDLVNRCHPNHVFMTWEWLFTWWRYFGHDRQLFIIVARDRNELIGLVPLMLAVYPRRHGDKVFSHARHLHFIGYRYEQSWNDCMDIPAVRKPEVIESLLDYLKQHAHCWDFVDFWDLEDGSETLLCVIDSARRAALPIIKNALIHPRPYIPMTSDWQSYYRTKVSKNLRKNTERRIRRLKETGTLAFVKAEPMTLMSHLAALFELYEKNEIARDKHVMFSQSAYQDFYRSLSQVCPFEWLDCPTLELNGKVIAASFVWRYNSKLLDLTPAFDPDYSAFAPGTVLLRYMIEDSFGDEQIGEYDFGWGDDAYKFDWTTTERQARRLLIGAPVSA